MRAQVAGGVDRPVRTGASKRSSAPTTSNWATRSSAAALTDGRYAPSGWS